MQLARVSALVLAPFIACVGGEAFETQEEKRTRPAVRAVSGAWNSGTDGADATIVQDGTAKVPAEKDGAFALGVATDVARFTEGTLETRFKLVSGASDQTAGLAFNVQPNGEYHFVRYNTKEGNVALWRFRNGERERVAGGTAKAELRLGQWHQLTVTIAGRRVTGLVNGTLRVEHDLDAPVDGGVGFWTKRDSVTAFTGFRVQPVSR